MIKVIFENGSPQANEYHGVLLKGINSIAYEIY